MKKCLAVAVTAALMGSGTAAAHVSEAEFTELKNQFATLAQRLSVLEAENQQLREQGTESVAQLTSAREDLLGAQEDLVVVKQQNLDTSWAERLSVTGDFRYRYEEIDVENADTRSRSRIRARSEMVVRLPDDVQLGVGLATGSGNDPVSANQTLGDGNGSKEISLDLAYAKWRPIESAYLEAGKFKNPLFIPQKTGLLWDGDWRPEGLNAAWRGEHFFATGLMNWLESDSKNSNEEVFWGLQGGLVFDVAGAKLTTAVGYFDIPIKGNESYYNEKFYGNSFVVDDGVEVYEYDYQLLELSAQLDMMILDLPLSFYGDYVQNQDPDDYNTGWAVGTQLGKAKGHGTWQVAYEYQDLEADGVLGLLSDSDFAGGGTDGKGSKLSGAYGVNEQWNLGVTWYIANEAGEKNLKDKGGALDYDRVMLDTSFKY